MTGYPYYTQPVAKPNRKCCVNGKVESGALKFFFLGSESSLSRSYYILHWNAKELTVFPLRLVHSSSRTSEDLKLARGCLPLEPFLKLPNFTVCVVRRRAAMLPPAPSDSLLSSPTGQLVQSDCIWNLGTPDIIVWPMISYFYLWYHRLWYHSFMIS